MLCLFRLMSNYCNLKKIKKSNIFPKNGKLQSENLLLFIITIGAFYLMTQVDMSLGFIYILKIFIKSYPIV